MSILVYSTVISLTSILFTGELSGVEKERLLSPKVCGTVTLNNVPISGVEIKRSLTFNGNDLETTQTDRHGRYCFDAIEVPPSYKLHALQDIRVMSTVSMVYKDVEYIFWQSKLHTFQPQPPIKKSLAQLNCEISEPLKVYSYAESTLEPITNDIYSLCSLPELTFEELY